MMIRLQKHIANLGICSRRRAEALISAGLVQVNGVVVTDMGVKIDPSVDVVSVDQTGPLPMPAKPSAPVYILLNKPVGYISSTVDTQGDSIMQLLTKDMNITPSYGRDITERVFPVGRLDKESEGLMILTNDGALTNELTHPRYSHEKEYEIIITEQLTHAAADMLERGMMVDGERYQGVRIIKERRLGKRTVVTVVLTEGKNRQIRKMFGRLGYTIVSLKRVRINNIRLGTLPPGRWKFVRKTDIMR